MSELPDSQPDSEGSPHRRSPSEQQFRNTVTWRGASADDSKEPVWVSIAWIAIPTTIALMLLASFFTF